MQETRTNIQKATEGPRRQQGVVAHGAAQDGIAPVVTMPAEGVARTRPVGVARPQSVQQITHNGLTWVNIVGPGGAEAEWLRQVYGFHPLHLEDVVSKIQRPKVDDSENYTFLVMNFPAYSKLVRITTPSEVDMFVGANYVITAHAGKLKPLQNLFQECIEEPETRERVMGRSPGYLLYAIVDRLVDYCFPILNKIDDNIEAVEDAIFEDRLRRTIQEISIIRRDIIAFRRIVKPLIPVVASLERKRRPIFAEDMDEYFGDIADHLSRIWDTLEEHKEVIESFSDTLNSLTTHRSNETIRRLTTISVILLPLTLITGLFGMNFRLPFENELWAFTAILIIMLIVIATMLAFFRWRKWI